MSLFQNSVLNKYLKGLESEKVNQAYKRFTSHFHNPTIQENIRNSKEEQYQGEFLIDLFVNVFGYVKNPTPDFNLTTELKNIRGSKKTDGAILSTKNSTISRDLSPLVKAVIELKGTNTTDLSKVETQAFGYKNNQLGCNYVITSNFEKLRFYIDNAVDFEEFNLFQLTKERFDMLWLCVSSEYLLKDIPKKIKDESLTQEENVTKKLYKDYASFRNEIFDAIQKENPKYDKLTLFKKTQKLLDRFLFIFFAEDRLLLPPNSIRSIVNQWTDLRDKYDAYFPLYDRFKKYFGYMNTGHKGQQHDIFAYNGGLFAPDEILDNIKINDELLHKHTVNLSNYDFESEVSVNILGHIFEHSLNDIDNLKGLKSLGETKRKKDGVFYTPKYITKYIVDNTVGKLCEEKKIELGIQEAEYEKERKGRKKATLKNLTKKLEEYRKWLLQITICDPACGSGAFLNQALEFLIAEHQYIDELQAKLFGDAMILSEVENSILENNIYGVDINEESVDIAKLSLWLRTAQKGRKLTSLNNNIKCGNSLIDDPRVAGDKAFNWQKEFPEVFKEKDKKIYHVTTAIHDSRTSARMKKYKVRERRDLGTNPYPNVIYFTPEDDLLITKTIAGIVKEDQLNLLAYNICADHIHLLLACDIKEIPAIMQKIKGRTSYTMGLSPLGKKEKKKPLWSQKYSAPKEVTTQVQLDNTLGYIQNNRSKHELPAHSKALETIIDSMCCSLDEAFTPEYTGGFDVIIGNPPYVQIQSMGSISNDLKNQNFETFEKTGDLYCLFYELGNIILKDKGLLGFITSNKWMRAKYGKSLRNYFLENTQPLELFDLGSGIFESATVDSNIIIFEKTTNNKNSFIGLDISKEKTFLDFKIYEDKKVQILFKENDIWTISNPEELKIKKKIEEIGIPLKDWDIKINRGLTTGFNDAFIINEIKKDELIRNDNNVSELIYPIVRGREILRYSIDFSNLYIINTHNGYKDINPINIDDYNVIKKHLDIFYHKLEKRADQGITPYNLRNCAYLEDFNKRKIVFSKASKEQAFTIDENKLVNLNTSYFLTGNDLELMLCVLNSRLAKYMFLHFYQSGGIQGEITIQAIQNIPIPQVFKSSQQPFIEKANQMLALNKNLQQKSNSFVSLLQSKFSIQTHNGFQPILSKKLQNWHELNFGEFLKELEKASKKSAKENETEYRKLSLSKEAEWMQYFNEQKQKAAKLKVEINKTNKEIDAMVYQLYGLTDEEIQIVEEATK